MISGGFINRKGEKVIQPQFLLAYPFQGGRARVEVAADSWRYIDRNGIIAVDIHFKYSIEARDFSEGFAAVFIEDPKRFECLGRVEQNLREDYEGKRGYISHSFCGRWGFIDKTGRPLMQETFDEAKDFHEGLAPVKIGKRWGYIDRNGKIAIPANFEKAGPFSEGLAWANYPGKLTCFIDRTGTMVINEQFGVAWPFSCWLARVKIGSGRGLFDTWRYINRSGEVVISRTLKGGWSFREGLALVGDGGLI